MACCNNFCNCPETITYTSSIPQCNGEERTYTCICQDNRCFTPMGGWGIFGRRWPLGGVSYTGSICCTCVADDVPTPLNGQ